MKRLDADSLVGTHHSELFEAVTHVPSGHPKTHEKSVGWVERSATHQNFSEQMAQRAQSVEATEFSIGLTDPVTAIHR